MSKQDYVNSHLYRIRHSTAHIMAEAMLERFPEAQIAIGPPIEDGFYYDFGLPQAPTEDDLKPERREPRRGLVDNDAACGQPRPTRARWSRVSVVPVGRG